LCSAKASLQFPVGHIHHLLKKGNYTQHVGAGAPLYLVAILEYLAAEILKLAGNAAQDNKQHCIVPWHLQLAVRNDEIELLGDIVISQGGVIPTSIPLSSQQKQERARRVNQSLNCVLFISFIVLVYYSV
jgi:histone H2A